jgi:hypothetical protein
MSEEKKELTRQEENWLMMTTLQMPWKDANAIDDPSDRAFILEKVKEVQSYLQKHEEVMQQQMAMKEKLGHPSDSNIITPDQFMTK